MWPATCYTHSLLCFPVQLLLKKKKKNSGDNKSSCTGMLRLNMVIPIWDSIWTMSILSTVWGPGREGSLFSWMIITRVFCHSKWHWTKCSYTCHDGNTPSPKKKENPGAFVKAEPTHTARASRKCVGLVVSLAWLPRGCCLPQEHILLHLSYLGPLSPSIKWDNGLGQRKGRFDEDTSLCVISNASLSERGFLIRTLPLF